MVLYPKDPHYKIHFDIAPATAIMIGISPPEGKKKGRLPSSLLYLYEDWFPDTPSTTRRKTKKKAKST